VAIFNRSHYEDVLVTRVHKPIDKATWTARYKRIREFETGLIDNGTTILKFFLHISKEEQLEQAFTDAFCEHVGARIHWRRYYAEARAT
jgi:polyphosphate kinase 2 (PPK2 family)